MLAFVAFRPEQEVDWSCVNLEDLFFLDRWCTEMVISLTDNRVHKRKREVDGRLVHHKPRLPSFTVRLKFDVWLSSLDDAVRATRESFGNERSDPSRGDVVV